MHVVDALLIQIDKCYNFLTDLFNRFPTTLFLFCLSPHYYFANAMFLDIV